MVRVRVLIARLLPASCHPAGSQFVEHPVVTPERLARDNAALKEFSACAPACQTRKAFQI
jgi:hypothetical protein